LRQAVHHSHTTSEILDRVDEFFSHSAASTR